MISERMANFNMALEMLGQGMLGIFVVLGIIALLVVILGKLKK